MPSPADVERLRLAQEGIRALVEADLRMMFASLNLAQPEDAAAALRAYIPGLVRQYGESASAMAADWYDETRASARVPGRKFRAIMADSPYQDASEGLARRAAGALFTPTPDDALTTLLPAVGKYVLGASRATIQASVNADPRASGWQRVVRSGGCDFCRMLAGRGGVYKESTVHFAAHGDCNCAAVPSWDSSAPEVDVTIYKASVRTTALRERAATGSPSDVLALKEHNALIQRAIEQYT